VQAGKLRYGVRDFPLEAIHPLAFKAAEATHCAGDQGRYWEMHGRLFANQRALAPADLLMHGQALGLDPQAFRDCLEGGKHAGRVRRDLGEGQQAGIRGTPVFFLGRVEGQGRLRVLRSLRGAQPVAAFKAAIDATLAAPD
jgi:protein-disulfide isomerase